MVIHLQGVVHYAIGAEWIWRELEHDCGCGRNGLIEGRHMLEFSSEVLLSRSRLVAGGVRQSDDICTKDNKLT
jgi:hypothetical protein